MESKVVFLGVWCVILAFADFTTNFSLFLVVSKLSNHPFSVFCHHLNSWYHSEFLFEVELDSRLPTGSRIFEWETIESSWFPSWLLYHHCSHRGRHQDILHRSNHMYHHQFLILWHCLLRWCLGCKQTEVLHLRLLALASRQTLHRYSQYYIETLP